MGKCLTPRVETRDNYAYPSDATFIEFGDGASKIHLIHGSLAVPDNDVDGTGYGNAPNGSTYIPQTATAGEQKVYVKFGAAGLQNGTWRATAQLT
jgi:hypothetical protein